MIVWYIWNILNFPPNNVRYCGLEKSLYFNHWCVCHLFIVSCVCISCSSHCLPHRSLILTCLYGNCHKELAVEANAVHAESSAAVRQWAELELPRTVEGSGKGRRVVKIASCTMLRENSKQTGQLEADWNCNLGYNLEIQSWGILPLARGFSITNGFLIPGNFH